MKHRRNDPSLVSQREWGILVSVLETDPGRLRGEREMLTEKLRPHGIL